MQLFHDPMGYRSPGSSAHGNSQIRILEWVAISLSRESSQPKDWTHVSYIVAFFTTEPSGKPWMTKSVLFSHSVMSDSLWPHGLQHTRLPCPSPTPGACSNSCPLSQWCHPTILCPVVPFSSYLLSCPASESLKWVSLSHQMAKVLELQLQHQFFQWIFRTDFLKDWLVWSPCSPRDSQESSPTPQFKSISSLVLSFFYSPT